MSAVVFAFAAHKSKPRPWQNHELAEFYRVIDILGRAGLGVVPDMGVSDEGDPWFAFCRADTGDVVVHCARIDGVCVATSIATSEVFRGTDIRDVINAIIRCRQAALVVAPSADARIYLHPMVVLTAFIAAALIFSNQASAHNLHSDGSGTVSDTPVTLAKIIATLKGMVGETVGSVMASGPNVVQTSTVQPEPEPFSLAVLMSAAMTVISPVIHGSEGLLGADAPVAPLPNPANMPSPHLMDALPLFENVGQSTTTFHSIDPLSSTLGVSSASPKVADFVDGAGNLVIPVINTEIGAHANGGAPSFLSASQISNPNFVTPPPAAPIHSGSAVVPSSGDSSSSTIEQPPSVHSTDLSEITPIALAVFLGNSSMTLPPTTPLASLSGPLSPAVDSSTRSALPAVAVDSSSSSAPATVGSASVDPSLPTNDLASSWATPATINMASNPIVGIEQLLDYALTSHPINVSLAVSSAFAAELPSNAAGTAQPALLVVFDSAAITVPFFEFVPGVLFVDDHDLGVSPSQASPAQLVTVDLANGGTMQLLGVVNMAHPTIA